MAGTTGVETADVTMSGAAKAADVTRIADVIGAVVMTAALAETTGVAQTTGVPQPAGATRAAARFQGRTAIRQARATAGWNRLVTRTAIVTASPKGARTPRAIASTIRAATPGIARPIADTTADTVRVKAIAVSTAPGLLPATKTPTTGATHA